MLQLVAVARKGYGVLTLTDTLVRGEQGSAVQGAGAETDVILLEL